MSRSKYFILACIPANGDKMQMLFLFPLNAGHIPYLCLFFRHDVVFQHFPLKKLADNPGVWTVLSYK